MKIIILMYELINLKKKPIPNIIIREHFVRNRELICFSVAFLFGSLLHSTVCSPKMCSLYVISISAKDQYSLSGWDNLLLLVTACWINCWHLSHTAPDLLSVSWWDCCWCRKALQGASLTGIYQLAGICWNSRQS